MLISTKVYGNDRPPIFETIGYINTLLETSNAPWTERVHGSFNSEIKRKMHDKNYWLSCSRDKEKLNETSKQKLLKELVSDMEERNSNFASSFR